MEQLVTITRVISFVFLFCTSSFSTAQGCLEQEKRFIESPKIDISSEKGGAFVITTVEKHEEFELTSLNLIITDELDGKVTSLSVRLGYFLESGKAVTLIDARNYSETANFLIMARYGGNVCSPVITKTFSVGEAIFAE